ncbi:dihydrolipoyllysine-residue acetyltransferase [Gallionella capsiferriformans]|uniref:Acetyltransferase component of pyruvate dehydrogenase complex n=1 Tax=Gallionella capsiferriformans (strain ES-2) TaxID=395494 RepID=D9SD69_GALCS|nr:dihydrolipoyllysine-residue acetyltransferase [Gallionella capsiferriformans]ADL56667.1 catalytic domain-containing protein of components of various dehydrogenase complexes [Gallionella capsiferriformans ES-2]
MAEIKQVLVPDIGDYKGVSVIEVMVKVGDTINEEDTLLTLETDKAAMDVPSPYSGIVKELHVEIGDKVSRGSLILVMESSDAAAPAAAPVAAPVIVAPVAAPVAVVAQTVQSVVSSGKAHASPAIRRFARELGADIAQIKGSGEKGRVTKEDVQNFIKAALAQPRGAAGGNGLQVLDMPVFDFAKFGTIETRPLSRIQKISGANLHRNWVTIPHVTQFDEADITEMEAFRKQLGTEYAKQNIKITPLAFMLKAVVAALQKFPKFNASLDGDNLILKQYFHIGVAVDTPDGLMVPVLRDVDKKGIVQLATELGEISTRARDKKITAADMQGGCFTISSLGGIGGTAFTPIINAPEVAILGVSRSAMKPVYQDGVFVPRLMLPLSVSYDHRVIDGAAAARFTAYLAQVLSDIRRLAL